MKRIILIMMALVCMVPLQATITIPGISFTITAKTYDRATGTFYVGLNGNASALTLNQATRGVAPSFSGIGAEDNPIELLTLATNNIGIPAAALIYVTQNMMMDFSQDTLNSVSINTSNTQTGMVQLVDALGINQDTSGIVGIASNASFAFAAVRPNPMQMNVNFGEIGSGIAIVGINPINFQLTQAAAVASSSAVQAFPLDQTIPPVNLPSTTSPGPANPTLFPNAEESYVNIIWDNPLQRLYVPLLEQLSTTSGSGGRDLVVGSFLDNTGTFTLTAIAPDSAFSLGSPILLSEK